MDLGSYNYLFKFILIGDSNVGKTCLLLQFIDKRFREEQDATIGVEFSSKTIISKGQFIKIQVWDTAGQESFRSITRSYYRGSIGALIVYDVTRKDSFLNIQKWIAETNNYANDKMVKILVGNKNDLSHKREVTYDEGEELAKANDMEFLETSAKTGLNVEKIFHRLSEKLLEKIERGEIDPKNENYGIKLGNQGPKERAVFSIGYPEKKRNPCCKFV